MTTITQIPNKIPLFPPLMPAVERLTFRKFRGEPDYPLMLDIMNAAKIADKEERSDTIEQVANNYAHLIRCNPATDVIFAEVNGQAVGYGRCWWNQDAATGEYLYEHFVSLKPEWRGKEIGKALTGYLQQRGRETAQEHPADAPKFFQVWTSETQLWNTELFENEGFKPVRYFFEMKRNLLEPLPNVEKPEGIEIRPYQPDQLHTIYLADVDAFRDHWGFIEPTEVQLDFKNWRDDEIFQPQLWKIAWVGDEVTGLMLNFLNEKENKEYARKRGYTENIATTRQFRKRGIASYLIAESMKMFKEMGMEHVALGVDAENPNGALGVYERLGYEVIKQHQTFRKRMKQGN